MLHIRTAQLVTEESRFPLHPYSACPLTNLYGDAVNYEIVVTPPAWAIRLVEDFGHLFTWPDLWMTIYKLGRMDLDAFNKKWPIVESMLILQSRSRHVRLAIGCSYSVWPKFKQRERWADNLLYWQQDV